MNNEIVVHNASKIFQLRNEKKIFALNNVSITIKQGVFYAIMGHSGAGKSTLIQILGLLDNLSDGEIYIDGINVHNLSEKEKSYIRMNNIGFIFQSFYLNSKLKAIENVMLPMYINTNINKKDRKIKAKELLKKFGLEERISHYPKELSGGEQQRVAIARALANDPQFILADEPTGNLDEENEKHVFDELKKLTKEGKTVVVVTHNEIVKRYADKVLYMNNGVIKEEI